MWTSVVYLVLLVLFAIFGPHIRHKPNDPVGAPLQGPSAQFLLGTDEQGRDILARLAAGAQTSLFVGFSVQVIALFVGIVVGVLGVFTRGWVSIPLMRLTDAMFAFPDILLAILIIGVFGMGLLPVIAALAVTAWPSVARLVRTQAASLKDREFFVASKALGAPGPYLVWKHVLPHLWGILSAVAMVDLAGTILAESALSFLGIGVQAPDASWGSMINTGRSYLQSDPLYIFWPCLLLSLTIFALNFVGDGIRNAVDPKAV
ncbi:MAG: ABC transporter permease [Fimbriimonadaceae bacterium]|nr:ABC transporter permease [Fimbriimonadaceae bacterium]QYK55743.1 MAG: ABC transporter permease [Fimbriimonadaceae bacterium]